MADIDTFAAGKAAYEAGCDFVGTTLSGYTEATKGRPQPDMELIQSLLDSNIPVIAEGGIHIPEQAKKFRNLVCSLRLLVVQLHVLMRLQPALSQL